MPKRRTTSQDIADHVGVSRTTVSFVLSGNKQVNISEETRQRVLDAARELGYVPDAAAQALARGRTQIIGLIFSRSEPHPTASIGHDQLMQGVLDIARRQGVRLMVDAIAKSDESDSRHWPSSVCTLNISNGE